MDSLTGIIIGVLALVVGFLFKNKLDLESIIGNKDVNNTVNNNNQSIDRNNQELSEEEAKRKEIKEKDYQATTEELLRFLNDQKDNK